MHDFSQSVPVCAVLDLLCKGTVEPVPEGTGSVRRGGALCRSGIGKHIRMYLEGLSLFESPSIKMRHCFSTNFSVCLSQEVFLGEH